MNRGRIEQILKTCEQLKKLQKEIEELQRVAMDINKLSDDQHVKVTIAYSKDKKEKKKDYGLHLMQTPPMDLSHTGYFIRHLEAIESEYLNATGIEKYREEHTYKLPIGHIFSLLSLILKDYQDQEEKEVYKLEKLRVEINDKV